MEAITATVPPLVWPDWYDGPRPLTLTGLLAQALGTVRSAPEAYPVLYHHPELEQAARQLVRAALDGEEAQTIIDAADRYLKTLRRVRRASSTAGGDRQTTERASARFAQADRAHQAMRQQLDLAKQLASAQPTLF